MVVKHLIVSANNFGISEKKKKTHVVKANIVFPAIVKSKVIFVSFIVEAGFNVIHSDNDIAFTKNPFLNHLENLCRGWDLLIQVGGLLIVLFHHNFQLCSLRMTDQLI